MTDTLKPADVLSVALVLGGSCYVSRAAFNAGEHGLRCYTKAGKPRTKRASSSPLYTGRALIIGASIAPAAPASPALPLIGVYVFRKGEGASRMTSFKARDGDLTHAIELADLYAAIDGNTRAEVRRFEGGGGPSQIVAIRSPRSRTRRMLSAVYHGSTHSTYHHIRNRHVRRDPAPFPGDHYGPARERYSSSVHVVISGRAGLFRDMETVKATPHDLTSPIPFRPGIVRKAACDATRLPG